MTSSIQRQLTSLSRLGISRNYSIRPGFFTALGHTSSSNPSIPVIARASPYSSPSGTHSIWRGTTILSVRKGDQVSVVGDGQITMGSQVVKPNARKVRRLGADNKVIAGFAGATADALTLFERLETKIDEHPEQLLRACVSLAKEWRMDKYLRRLDAMLLVCDADMSLYLTGTGDVIEPPDGIIGIGSGSSFAIAAARALIPFENLTAEEIAKRSMDIAADLCIYTNNSFITEVINGSPESKSDEDAKSEPDASSGK